MKGYHSFSHSTRGASHKKSNLDCQDASLDNEKDNDERMSTAIVADGHGSPQYFRSDIGSQKATEVALKGIQEFIAHTDTVMESFSGGDGEKLLKGLARNIIATWFGEVEDDEKAHPLKDDERLNLIDDKYKNRYLNDPNHQYFHHAYGTTLIAVAMTESYWFGLHIGDGKCVVLFDDGNWEQPIPWDDKCFLNSTTSICDDDAISEFRFWYGPTPKDGRKPVAMFVGSDGVDDTYPVHENEKHLKYLYRSIVLSFAKDGHESTLSQIDDLIQKLAEQGSQDDVSIAGIIGDVAPYVELLSAQDVADKAADKAAEDRKKAELKKQAEEAAQAKAEQQEKREQEIRKKEAIAKKEYERKQAELKRLEARNRRQKKAIEEANRKATAASKAIEEADRKAKAASTDLAKKQTELRSIEAETLKRKETLRIAEAERKAAEAQALQQEEQSRTYSIKAKVVGVGFVKNIDGELLQFGKDAEQAINVIKNDLADATSDLIKKAIQGTSDDEK